MKFSELVYSIFYRLRDVDYRKFFMPSFTPAYLIRVGIVVLLAFLFFGYVCIPAYINGSSMVPTYPPLGVNFCWCPSYWFSGPESGDIVILRYQGREKMLLKRVLAFAGDTVEFRKGILYVNGKAVKEPYVKKPCDWNWGPKKVEHNEIFVVGDNRSMSVGRHDFGIISKKRMMGAPLW